MVQYFGLSLLILVAITLGASLSRTLQETDQVKTNDGNENRIVGGHDVNIFKHPHQISIRLKRSNTTAYGHYCGGSIYKRNVIITVAHCVIGYNPENFIVVAGTSNRRGGDGTVALLRKIIMHENYDPLLYDNDIALIILSTPLPLNNVTIAAIALTAASPKRGARAVITGWGTTSSGGYPSDNLLEVEVPIVGRNRCDSLYAAYFGPGRITDSMICAGIENVGGKDACQGDSGGPLLVNNRLTGIVSWGLGCALPQYPGVYSNVAIFLDWITNTVRENA